MRKDHPVFSFYLSFSHFVKLQIPTVYLSFSRGKPAANHAANLQQIVMQITMQITMQTCSKSPYKQGKS